jgi:HAD superfamily hydrolase (TIGR01450 family)
MSAVKRFYQAYIFDLDGTVYLGNHLLPTAGATITTLRQRGSRTVFLSNNPTHTRAEYAEKLTRLGLPTPPEDVVNSTVVMADYLKQQLPGGRLFVMGETPLINELRAAGFILTEDPQQVDAVIASFDRTFVYRKLQIAFDAIRAGARFFATNGDRYCPVPGGGEPDAAAIIAAVEACTNTRVETIVGKPSVHMLDAVRNLVKAAPQDCLMTGDRLETDIRMGQEAGMDTALTLTGATSQEILAASAILTTVRQPTYVLQQLNDLIPDTLNVTR